MNEKAREVIARVVAAYEDHPDLEDYSLADDIIFAMENAGLAIVNEDGPKTVVPDGS